MKLQKEMIDKICEYQDCIDDEYNQQLEKYDEDVDSKEGH